MPAGLQYVMIYLETDREKSAARRGIRGDSGVARKPGLAAHLERKLHMIGVRHLIWIPAGMVIGFASSFLFGDLLTLPFDLYYFIYFLIVGGFFAFYVRRTKLDLGRWAAKRIVWGMVLGVLVGAVMVQHVLSLPATEQFNRVFLAWAVLWRGVVYGTVDGILLFTFPWLVAWRALGGEARSLAGKAAVSLLAWVFILVVTTAYHLGYRDFRSEKIMQPNIGSTIAAVPTLLSANPFASVVTHVFLHVAAVVHSPQTSLFLPPHR